MQAKGSDMADAIDDLEPVVPVLWLLGKTGAGKTSLIHALTGEGEVGSGFEPGTFETRTHDFPNADAPAVRFLDTRGLGEAGYDPSADIAAAQSCAHAILAVVRLDDPVQDALIEVLKSSKQPVLVVFTGVDLLPDQTATTAIEAEFLKKLGRKSAHVSVALPAEGMVTGVENLLTALDSFMPHAVAILRREAEARDFAQARSTVLRYAAVAGACDVVPVAGVATVPASQTAMLQALAKRHRVQLTPKRLGLLASALGTGTLVRLGTSHALRQAAKLVPFAGQTLGTAAAAGASFATTYALGRAASAWLYGVARGREADPTALRALYDAALKGAQDGAR